jgi:hypothetical protein
MAMTASNSLIRALDYCPADASPIESARRIAEDISNPIRAGQIVVVSMEGLLGASSSFFNVIYSTLRDLLGAKAVETHLTFIGLGPAMKMVEGRSRRAILGVDP